MDSKITFKEIAHKSSEWDQAVELRLKLLRVPLGLGFTQEDLDNEASEIHYSGFVDGKTVATAILKKVNDEDVKMRQVCVDDSCQGKGYGSELVKVLETAAKERGYKKMVVHARKTALKFYERLGYQIEGDEFTEVTVPHYKVVKAL